MLMQHETWKNQVEKQKQSIHTTADSILAEMGKVELEPDHKPEDVKDKLEDPKDPLKEEDDKPTELPTPEEL